MNPAMSMAWERILGWFFLAILTVLCLCKDDMALAACENTRPYRVENVTVEKVSNTSVLIRYDLPHRQWNLSPPHSVQIKIDDAEKDVRVLWEKGLSTRTSSFIATNLPPHHQLNIEVNPMATVYRTGCKHPLINYTILPPVDGVWSEWKVVKECRRVISCDDPDISMNGTLRLDRRRSSERHCDGPRFGGEPCEGDAERNEPCPVLILPPCPPAIGVNNAAAENDVTRRPSPSAVLPAWSYAVLALLCVTPALVIVLTVAYKQCQGRRVSPSPAHRPQTVTLDNFSMALSDENGTFLDLAFGGPFGTMASISRKPVLYVCHAHELPTPSGLHQQKVMQLASVIQESGVQVVLPDWELASLMENVEEWFQNVKETGVDGVVVVCSKELVELWQETMSPDDLESPSQRLAHQECKFLKKLVAEEPGSVAPVVLKRCLNKVAAKCDLMPAVLQRCSQDTLYLHLATDQSAFWQRLLEFSGRSADSVSAHSWPDWSGEPVGAAEESTPPPLYQTQTSTTPLMPTSKADHESKQPASPLEFPPIPPSMGPHNDSPPWHNPTSFTWNGGEDVSPCSVTSGAVVPTILDQGTAVSAHQQCLPLDQSRDEVGTDSTAEIINLTDVGSERASEDNDHPTFMRQVVEPAADFNIQSEETEPSKDSCTEDDELCSTSSAGLQLDQEYPSSYHADAIDYEQADQSASPDAHSRPEQPAAELADQGSCSAQHSCQASDSEVDSGCATCSESSNSAEQKPASGVHLSSQPIVAQFLRQETNSSNGASAVMGSSNGASTVTGADSATAFIHAGAGQSILPILQQISIQRNGHHQHGPDLESGSKGSTSPVHPDAVLASSDAMPGSSHADSSLHSPATQTPKPAFLSWLQQTL